MKYISRIMVLSLASAAFADPVLAHYGRCGEPGLPACADGWMSPEMRQLHDAGGTSGSDDAHVGASDGSGARILPDNADRYPGGAETVAGGLSEECGVLEEWVRELCQGGLDLGVRVEECNGFYLGEVGGVLPVSGCSSRQVPEEPVRSASFSKDQAAGVSTGQVESSVDAAGGYTLNFDDPSQLAMWNQGAKYFASLPDDDIGKSIGYIDFASGSRAFMVAPDTRDPALQKYRPLRVRDGKLVLTSRRLDTSDHGVKRVIDRAHSLQNDGKDITWSGGQISIADPRYEVRPGDRYEVRMRTNPAVPGVGGAAWLFDDKTQNEIDVADLVGYDGMPTSHVHNGGKGASMEAEHDGVNFGQWHTYALDYNPGNIRVSIDGKPVKTFTGGISGGFTTPMYPLLSMGGGDTYHRTPDHVDKLEMEVDSLRVIRGGANKYDGS